MSRTLGNLQADLFVARSDKTCDIRKGWRLQGGKCVRVQAQQERGGIGGKLLKGGLAIAGAAALGTAGKKVLENRRRKKKEESWEKAGEGFTDVAQRARAAGKPKEAPSASRGAVKMTTKQKKKVNDRIKKSAEAARKAGVPEEKIINNISELDDFMRK